MNRFYQQCLIPIVTLVMALSANATIIYNPIVSQDSVTPGDRITLTVSLVVAPGAGVTAPETAQGFGPFIVKDWTFNKTERKQSDSIFYNYSLALYSAEQCTIPSLVYIVSRADSLSDTLRTQPITLKVVSLLAPNDSIDILDLKPQQIAGKPPVWWLWLLLAIAVIVSAVFFGKKLFNRLKKEPPPPPPKPPYDEAIDALRALEEKQYLQKSMIREYVFELSEILKRYIGRRFETNASEFTTEEMLDWIEKSPLDISPRRMLEWFFTATDPVKFAKFVPERNTIERFGVDARAFIEKTRPLLQPLEQSQEKGSAENAV